MTDMTRFERRVAALLREIADGAPGTRDGVAMARLATTSSTVRQEWLRVLSPSRPLALLFAVLALVMTLVAGLFYVGAEPRLPLVEATAEPTSRPTYQLVDAPPSPPLAHPTGKIGFVGLPPEGAIPSSPETGVLVFAYEAGPPWDRVHVFADGRYIWARAEEGLPPFAATEYTTGLLEQRLTPSGVELLKNEALATGLFDIDHELPLRLWWRDTPYFWVGVGIGSDYRGKRISPTTEQGQGLRRLHSILTEPISWFPESAWQDREIRAFVPARFGVCLVPAAGSTPVAVTAALPSDASEILATSDLTSPPSWAIDNQACYELPTDAARGLAAALDAAGLGRGSLLSELSYEISTRAGEGWVIFDPILPDGSPTCLGCG